MVNRCTITRRTSTEVKLDVVFAQSRGRTPIARSKERDVTMLEGKAAGGTALLTHDPHPAPDCGCDNGRSAART